MPNAQDRQLNSLLAEVCRRLASAADDPVYFDRGDFPDGREASIEPLVRAGLLRPAEPAKAVTCEGCERLCPMPVEFAHARSGREARAFVVCDKRDDIGRVEVLIERLQRWQSSIPGVATTLCRLFGSNREPTEEGDHWNIGEIRLGRVSAEAALYRSAGTSKTGAPLAIVLGAAGHPSPTNCIRLDRLLTFRDGALGVQQAVLRKAISKRFDDQRVAWEVKYEAGNIVLVNHVTSNSCTIASPNFDSTNDNAFQVLYGNPGRKLSLDELRAEAREPTIGDLHKMVENLNFAGVLKKAFFRVSRNAIQFERTATLGRLATLRIDPAADL